MASSRTGRRPCNVDPGDVIECTFTNRQRNSLIIQKQAKDASTDVTGLEPLGGVTFRSRQIRTPAPARSSSSDEELGEDAEDAFNLDRGLICVDSVDPDITSFSIDETNAPAGYKDGGHAVGRDLDARVVRRPASMTLPDAVFENIPLSTIEVLFTSQAAGDERHRSDGG